MISSMIVYDFCSALSGTPIKTMSSRHGVSQGSGNIINHFLEYLTNAVVASGTRACPKELGRYFQGSTVQVDPDFPIVGPTLDWWLYCTAAQGQEREQHFTSGLTFVLDKLN